MNTLPLLESKLLRTEVDPKGGAYLRSLQMKHDGEWKDVFQKGKSLFVMAPYPNRVIGGSFPWQGRSFELNHPHDKDTAIHGVFRYVSWNCSDKSDSKITLNLRSVSNASEFSYPSDYEATLKYSLLENTLRVSLQFKNTGNDALPFGTGPHMYALRHVFGSSGPELKHLGESWFPPEPGDFLPGDSPEPLPEDRQYATSSPWSTDWDHCVGTWGSSAEITWPDVGLSIEVVDRLGNCPYLQIWNTEEQEICALEPQTMVPTKLGDTEACRNLGCILLAPGEEFSAEWDFVFKLSS